MNYLFFKTQIAVLKGGPAFQEVIKHGGNPTGTF